MKTVEQHHKENPKTRVVADPVQKLEKIKEYQLAMFKENFKLATTGQPE